MKGTMLALLVVLCLCSGAGCCSTFCPCEGPKAVGCAQEDRAAPEVTSALEEISGCIAEKCEGKEGEVLQACTKGCCNLGAAVSDRQWPCVLEAKPVCNGVR